VLGVLTGHVLKDPEATIGYHAGKLPRLQPRYANKMLQVDDNLDEIIRVLGERAP